VPQQLLISSPGIILFSSINQTTKMKFIIVSMMTIFFFWACVYSVDESPTRSESSIDEAFQKWMLDFGRTYANSTEMKKRREIFKKELEFIDKFNSEGNFLVQFLSYI
jgi:2-polyprenyl-3-methyl-5-hydroxy-6-metoxy-1,4-benzoquinol methylase